MVNSEQFDANASSVPHTFAAARWLVVHYYIQFDAIVTISYLKVNFGVETICPMDRQIKAKLGLKGLFMPRL